MADYSGILNYFKENRFSYASGFGNNTIKKGLMTLSIDIKQALKRLMQEGTPLHNALTEGNPTTKKKPSGRKKPIHKVVSDHRTEHEDDEFELVESFEFIFRGRRFEVSYPQNTVILTDLDSYESYISHLLWEDEHIQDLHYYLQTNWADLPVHSDLDRETTVYHLDDYYSFLDVSELQIV